MKYLKGLSAPILLALGLSGLALSGCSTLAKQFGELAAFTKCRFRLAAVSDTSLLGIRLQGKKGLSDFKLTDVMRLQGALTGGSLPLSFTLDLEVKNPNTSAAGLSGMEWILFLDGDKLTTGTLAQGVRIPAGGVGPLPLRIDLDLNQVLSHKNFDAMMNLALNIAGEGAHPTRLTMKVKPSITVAGQTVFYPDYVSVSHEFGGK